MKRMNNALIYIAGIVMIGLTLLANLQVLTRFVLQIPFPWVEEVIRYTMIYLVLVLSSTAIYLKSHFNVDVLDFVLKGRSLTILEKTRTTLVFAFAVVYTYLSYQIIVDTIKMGQVTPVLQISMAWPLSAILIGGILIAINCIYLLFPQRKKIDRSQ